MVSLCPRVSAGVFRFDICGGAAVGFIRGVGTGFDEGASTLGTTVDVALHARPGVRLGRFLLTLDLGVGLALLRPTFVAEDSMGAENGVYEPRLLWGEAQLGLGVAFD